MKNSIDFDEGALALECLRLLELKCQQPGVLSDREREEVKELTRRFQDHGLAERENAIDTLTGLGLDMIGSLEALGGYEELVDEYCRTLGEIIGPRDALWIEEVIERTHAMLAKHGDNDIPKDDAEAILGGVTGQRMWEQIVEPLITKVAGLLAFMLDDGYTLETIFIDEE